MLHSFRLDTSKLPPALETLREEVRDFIESERREGSFTIGPGGWQRYDRSLSMKIGAKGWIGMTWPKRYGGHERSAMERYVVTEELLAAGMPLRAHWVGDRQIGPNLLKFGTEEQKSSILPRIARGELSFCVGLSEPDSGSDLASIRSRAIEVDGGWRVQGTKIWQSIAHKAEYMTLFVRTSPLGENKHEGISQFLVDMTSPGISVRPIINLVGEHDFNEVHFEDVFVPDSAVIGTIGNGWNQVSGELAYERSGADRWFGTFDVFAAGVDRTAEGAENECAIGRLAAQFWTLHRMSLGIAQMLEEGVTPNVEAALVKDLATNFDQEIPAVLRQVVPADARARLPEDDPFPAMLDHALKFAPALTIKGGTKEILRGIIARGLGLR
ncbi:MULTISPECIES: acyl-CoA dehydrogenase family protein [Chelativorans]|jgi:alkylation response protein AidB-like acyl-CoA dehydrogenase|uniref:Acyl-CoA dehydrogenase-like protein n=1 Tax=Chelativorans sp. (strain BNC1) TaxID=266779 RepID=Q11D76_CHESB|nr:MULTISPECIES: acyl-CoA dehydrogenase family protein [Chelativorans]